VATDFIKKSLFPQIKRPATRKKTPKNEKFEGAVLLGLKVQKIPPTEKSQQIVPKPSPAKELTHQQKQNRKLCYSPTATGRRVKLNCQTTKVDLRENRTTKSAKRGFSNKNFNQSTDF
jgi:hypothetical protein